MATEMAREHVLKLHCNILAQLRRRSVNTREASLYIYVI